MRRALAALALLALASGPAAAQSPAELATLKLPPGFHIALYARVPGARSMAVAPELGAVFVGQRGGDSVYAVADAGLDGKDVRVRRIADGLRSPNGVAWRDGYLYVAEQQRVFRVKVPSLGEIGRFPGEVLFDALPDKSHHGWRYIAFDAKGRLYVTVGSPCNVCAGQGIEGTIIRLEGGRPVVVAKGIRNSVGMDFHPRTGDLYFTDNGADGMGDDSPPDELNHASRDGLDFGFPYFGGGWDVTPPYRDRIQPYGIVGPVVDFHAHVAALGVHFYRGEQFPEKYRGDAYVAQHGSWNRSSPIGYRVMRVRMDPDGKVLGTEPFAEGWLQANGAWGRPVDVKELPDGSLLVSDDRAGAIYRITYRE